MDSFPLESIESGQFNSRIRYASAGIERLADSLEKNGQLTPIRLRKSPRHEGKYEVIDGHRRVMSAGKLGWKTIRAEVVEKSDEQTLCESLIENYEREELSDYEKALLFERMNKEFNKTYEEIGCMVNLSRQQVSSYIAMLRLFPPIELGSNIELSNAIHQLSEHHARILSRVQDRETREDLMLMVVRRHLSIRELTNIISHLKVWFPPEISSASLAQKEEPAGPLNNNAGQDLGEIRRILNDEFRLSHRGDFERFRDMHLLEDRLSVFFSLPPHDIYQGSEAMARDREWFYHVASRSKSKIRDVKVELLGETAVATLKVEYETLVSGKMVRRAVRGSVVLVKRDREWKIFHEHWSEIGHSPLDNNLPSARIQS